MPRTYKERGRLELATETSSKIIEFNIYPEEDYIRFNVSHMDLFISVPVFKWKDWECEDDVWRIDRPDIIWYKEFPSKVYLKFPDNTITLFGDNINIDIDKSEVILNANKETQIFECDTTKIPSWWFGTTNYLLNIGYENESFNFLRIITRNILNSADISGVPMKSVLKVKSDVSGFNDCIADVKCDNEIVAEKVTVKASGFEVKSPCLSGNFEIIFYEYDSDEDDEFGLEVSNYTEFGRIRKTLRNTFDMDTIVIELKCITRDKRKNEWFDPENFVLSRAYFISKFEFSDEFDCYVGIMSSQNKLVNGLKVSVRFLENSDYKKAEIKYYDESTNTFVPFMYNKALQSLCLNTEPASARCIPVSDKLYFVIKFKNGGNINGIFTRKSIEKNN